jgi:hypothetical protein
VTSFERFRVIRRAEKENSSYDAKTKSRLGFCVIDVRLAQCPAFAEPWT